SFGGSASVTIGGAGALTLQSVSSITPAISPGSNGTVTIGKDLVVHGSGTLGVLSGTGRFTNLGTIAVDAPSNGASKYIAAWVPLENRGLIRVDSAKHTFAAAGAFYNAPGARITIDQGMLAPTG